MRAPNVSVVALLFAVVVGCGPTPDSTRSGLPTVDTTPDGSQPVDTGKVDNRVYKSWAKYKPGTAVVQKQTTERDGTKSEAITTMTLVEVKDDKVVIETEFVIKLNGMEEKSPARRSEVPRQLDEAVGFDPKTGKPEGTIEEGKEKVKVDGTEYECRWFKIKGKRKLTSGVVEVEGKVWLSDDMPMRVVKMEGKTTAGTVTMEVTEVTLKK